MGREIIKQRRPGRLAQQTQERQRKKHRRDGRNCHHQKWRTSAWRLHGSRNPAARRAACPCRGEHIRLERPCQRSVLGGENCNRIARNDVDGVGNCDCIDGVLRGTGVGDIDDRRVCITDADRVERRSCILATGDRLFGEADVRVRQDLLCVLATGRALGAEGNDPGGP